jgi:peptidyl-prolyl cis-trans isomerase C
MIKNGFCLILLTLFLVIVSCTKEGDNEMPVAQVDKTPISLKKFNQQWARAAAMPQLNYQGPEGKQRLLDELVKRELILQEARRKGLDKDPALEEEVSTFRENLILQKFLKTEIENKVTISDEEIKAFYDNNMNQMRSQEESQVSHILVKTEREAEDLLAKLKKGSRFDSLAKQYSIDPGSRKSGGDMGFVKRGQFVPPFQAAMDQLQPGQTSGTVKTQFGYHIIKLHERREGKALSYPDIQASLKNQLLSQRRDKTFEELINQLKKSAKIEINKELLQTEGSSQTKPQGDMP